MNLIWKSLTTDDSALSRKPRCQVYVSSVHSADALTVYRGPVFHIWAMNSFSWIVRIIKCYCSQLQICNLNESHNVTTFIKVYVNLCQANAPVTMSSFQIYFSIVSLHDLWSKLTCTEWPWLARIWRRPSSGWWQSLNRCLLLVSTTRFTSSGENERNCWWARRSSTNTKPSVDEDT